MPAHGAQGPHCTPSPAPAGLTTAVLLGDRGWLTEVSVCSSLTNRRCRAAFLVPMDRSRLLWRHVHSSPLPISERACFSLGHQVSLYSVNSSLIRSTSCKHRPPSVGAFSRRWPCVRRCTLSLAHGLPQASVHVPEGRVCLLSLSLLP